MNYNRTVVLDHLKTVLARAGQAGNVGVLIMDLDDFKLVNDSFGRAAGDEFLTQVSERIAGTLPEASTLARIGGDEFAVVVDGIQTPDAATELAHRIQAALSTGIPVRGQRLGAFASIGIAISSDRSTPEALVGDADAAMSCAKQQGRRRLEAAHEHVHERNDPLAVVQAPAMTAVRPARSATQVSGLAARLLPAGARARYAEELLDELYALAEDGVPRGRQLACALRQLTCVPALRRAAPQACAVPGRD